MSSRCREALAFVLALALGGCEREARDFPHPDPGAEVGGADAAATMVPRYERNAYTLASGKRLFAWYNCASVRLMNVVTSMSCRS